MSTQNSPRRRATPTSARDRIRAITSSRESGSSLSEVARRAIRDPGTVALPRDVE